MLKSLRIIVYFICGLALLCQQAALANDFFNGMSPPIEGKTRYGMGYESRIERARLSNDSTDIDTSRPVTSEASSSVEKVERVERPKRIDRSSRPERPMRGYRSFRPERPTRPGR